MRVLEKGRLLPPCPQSYTPSEGRATSPPDSEEIEKIACFFEEHLYFYDQTHALHKNQAHRDFELGEFARSIGWDCEYNLIGVHIS